MGGVKRRSRGPNKVLFWRAKPDFPPLSLAGSPSMTLVSTQWQNPVPEDVVSGHHQGADGAELRFARWAPPAGRKGGLSLTGRGEQIEKYFETVRDLRRPRVLRGDDDWRGQGKLAAPARSAQGL